METSQLEKPIQQREKNSSKRTGQLGSQFNEAATERNKIQ
jgi:hypothetical protein